MYITGAGWMTAGGAGKGRGDAVFDYKEGVLPDIHGDDFPVNPVFRKGRLDRFSLLGLQAITNTLLDAGLYEWEEKRNIGVIASTVYGCLATDLDYYKTVIDEKGRLPDPNLFTHTLSNIFIGYAAILFGLTGPNYILYDKNNSGLSALDSAMEHITTGECDIMLAGICDVESPQGFTCIDKFRPGAVFIVIEKDPSVDKKPFGRLSRDRAGKILFNNSIIDDIESCLRECLKNKREILCI